jgi:hypothetical protein
VTAGNGGWRRIEDEFRLWSFGVYYNRTFDGERDVLRRFVKALLASARPIRDRDAVVRWYGSRRGRAVLR